MFSWFSIEILVVDFVSVMMIDGAEYTQKSHIYLSVNRRRILFEVNDSW